MGLWRHVTWRRCVEVLISYQMQKTAMFYLQNCDLWILFKNGQNLEFSEKTMHRRKKSHEYFFLLPFTYMYQIWNQSIIYIQKLNTLVNNLALSFYYLYNRKFEIKSLLNIVLFWRIQIFSLYADKYLVS